MESPKIFTANSILFLTNYLTFLSSRNSKLDLQLKAGPSSDIKTYTPPFIASPFFETLRVSGPEFFTSAQSSAEVLFNQPHSEFSEVLREFGSKMTMLSKKIIEIVLMCLGETFDAKFKLEFSECDGYLRIINYSPPDCPFEKEVEVLGMHTDMSCVTIVYQDDIGGASSEVE